MPSQRFEWNASWLILTILIHGFFLLVFLFFSYLKTSVPIHDGLAIDVSLPPPLHLSLQKAEPVFPTQGQLFPHLAAPQYQSHVYSTAQRRQRGCTRGPLFAVMHTCCFLLVRVICVCSVQQSACIICSDWLPGTLGSHKRSASKIL